MSLRYTPSALSDLKKILDYVSYQSPLGARRLKERVQKMIEHAAEFPSMGVRTNDVSIRRMLVLPFPYAIYYEQVGEDVVIHRIRHTGRRQLRRPKS